MLKITKQLLIYAQKLKTALKHSPIKKNKHTNSKIENLLTLKLILNKIRQMKKNLKEKDKSSPVPTTTFRNILMSPSNICSHLLWHLPIRQNFQKFLI